MTPLIDRGAHMDQTFFAPTGRATQEDLDRQIGVVSNSPLFNTFLSTVEGVLVVLNEQRQIVGINTAFLGFLGVEDPELTLGLRLGESLCCVHSHEMPGGCGTSKSCGSCGAVIAMMSCLETGQPAERICALEMRTSQEESKSLSLLVRSSLLSIEGFRFLVIGIRDISKEQMRANLEKVFYHDVNNILSALLAPSEMLMIEMPDRSDVAQIRANVQRLKREVALQQELRHSEQMNYAAERKPVFVHRLCRELENMMHSHHALKKRRIVLVLAGEDFLLDTDELLVNRVLSNMLINALEATPAGGEVLFSTRREGDMVVWNVHNETAIPESIKPRIFQRYFSTKEKMGRGLGTYSMKLFGEMFLGGKVSFTSNEIQGTVFTFQLPISRKQ